MITCDIFFWLIVGVLISCLQKQQIAHSFIEKGIRAVTNACDTSLMGVDVFHFVTFFFLICFLHPNSPLPSIVVKQSTELLIFALKWISCGEIYRSIWKRQHDHFEKSAKVWEHHVNDNSNRGFNSLIDRICSSYFNSQKNQVVVWTVELVRIRQI